MRTGLISPSRVPPGRYTAHRILFSPLSLMVLLINLSGCTSQNATEVVVLAAVPVPSTTRSAAPAGSTPTEELSPRILRRFAMLPKNAPTGSRSLIDLGRMLYFEPRLSSNGLLSCNSCHLLDRYGTTDTKVSVGVNGQLGSRNAPSTYNASGHFTQFWDGRAPTVEAQAMEPIQNPTEMGMTPAGAVAILRGIDGYITAFGQAFPGKGDPITLANIGTAIGAFERGLVTPSRWDRYLAGDTSALNSSEKEGAKHFANLGCMVCHTGPYIGGSMFEKVGARTPWPNQKDKGRSAITGNAADDMVFKVPSLRNVAQTGPYFHDGTAATLNTAVRMMAKHQLGLELTHDEAVDLEHWLGSLTGDVPHDYVAKPILPAGKPK